MGYKENWDETKENFKAWWRRESIGRPLMDVRGKLKKPIEEPEPETEPETPAEKHLGIGKKLVKMKNYCRAHRFMGEAFPFVELFVVPSAMALFQGCEPNFAWETGWHEECVTNTWQEFGPLKFDAENKWWKLHLELLEKAKVLAGDDILITVSDLLENVDVLALMRGTQNFCYDLADEPEVIKEYIEQLDNLYFQYYDRMYDIVKDKDGGSCPVFFNVWTEGKIGKLQSDFSALMSPDQFRELVVPSMKKLCRGFQNTLYHLDGQEAIKHLEALLEVEKIDAIQWMPGAGRPGTLDECWYPVYDRIRRENKGLWIHIEKDEMKGAVEGISKLVKRYGSAGLFIRFPEMDEEEATELFRIAKMSWK